MPRQPQAAQGAQEWGWRRGTEQALGQCQLLQVQVERKAAELLQGQPQPVQQLLVQHLQQGRRQLSGVPGGRAEPPQHPPWPRTCVRVGAAVGGRRKGTPSTLPTRDECSWSPSAGHSSSVRCTWSCSGKAGEAWRGQCGGIMSVGGLQVVGGGWSLTCLGLELEEGTAPRGAQHPVAGQGALHLLPGQAAAPWGRHWHHLRQHRPQHPAGHPPRLPPSTPLPQRCHPAAASTARCGSRPPPLLGLPR